MGGESATILGHAQASLAEYGLLGSQASVIAVLGSAVAVPGL